MGPSSPCLAGVCPLGQGSKLGCHRQVDGSCLLEEGHHGEVLDSLGGDLEPHRHVCTDAALGRFGIVTSCRALSEVGRGPELCIWVAKGPRRLEGYPEVNDIDGTGVDVDGGVARAKAVAECLERYAVAAQPVGHPHVRAAFENLGEAAVDPGRFALFSADQHRNWQGLQPLTRRKTLDWCWGYSLAEARPVLVPAVLVHARGDLLPSDALPELTSTGMACDVRLAPAIWAGLCEVIERDALSVAWRSRLPFTPLDPEGTGLQQLLDGPLGRSGVTFQLFDVPTDLPSPVVMAVGWDDVRYPHAAVGAACRSNRIEAGRKALYEVAQMMTRSGGKAAVLPERVRTFEDHASLYATPRWAGILRRALGSRPACPLGLADRRSGDGIGQAPECLDELVGALAGLGLETIVVELTTPDVATTGHRVVRVMLPGAEDINGDLRFPRLGGRRLYEVPVRLGLAEVPPGEADLRQIPIPLA